MMPLLLLRGYVELHPILVRDEHSIRDINVCPGKRIVKTCLQSGLERCQLRLCFGDLIVGGLDSLNDARLLLWRRML